MRKKFNYGFDINGCTVPWGTTMDQFKEDRSFVFLDGDSVSGTYACNDLNGIGVISVKLTAPRSDRPIMQLCYELAVSKALKAYDWLALISNQLGAPTSLEQEDLPPSDHLADSVSLYACWDDDITCIGLSVYGAARATEYGNSAACLWISWNTALAAQPFLEDWHRRNENVAAIAAREPTCRIFKLSTELCSHQSGHARDSFLALFLPEILNTPPDIAEKLSKRSFALWYSATDACWAASTKWDTVFFSIGNLINVSHIELQPAKGGGSSELRVGPWEVRDCYGPKEIEAAAAFLAVIPGVKINKHDGYDC